jgi:hypothetical protein
MGAFADVVKRINRWLQPSAVGNAAQGAAGAQGSQTAVTAPGTAAAISEIRREMSDESVDVQVDAEQDERPEDGREHR